MTSPPMEVEIKIRLPGREDYDKLVSILEKTLVSTEYQENHFFDGPNSELREKRNVLRTRLIQEMKKDEIVDKYAVVTLKGNAQLVDGISRVEEYEDRIGWDDAKAICAEPARLLQLEQHYSQLEPIREVRQRFPQLESLKEIGTFTNIRKLHCWEDHELALDHTTFAFGHAYEIEVETDTPEMLKEKLLALLKQHQIEHTDSTSNKFAIMMRNSL